MAKVWFAQEGTDPTLGAPAYDDLLLEQCIDQLGLTKKHWLHGLNRIPTFGRPSNLPQEPRHAVCQVDEQEAADEAWMAGFYLLEISSNEVAKRLGPPEVGGKQ